MAIPLKRGTATIEVVIVLPLIVMINLCLLQLTEIIKITWFADQALESACRAALVQKESHPNPQVAAQLALAPVTGTTYFKNLPELPKKGFLGRISRFGMSILKTNLSFKKNEKTISCQLTHAAELTIPLANHVIKAISDPIQLIAKSIYKKEPLNLADQWTVITGRPHLLIEKELEISY